MLLIMVVFEAERQQKDVEKLHQKLSDLHAKQQLLKDELTSTCIAKIAVIRQRHKKLQLQLVVVLGMLEDYAMANNLVQIDAQLMRKLEADFAAFHDEFQAGCPHTRIFALRDTIRALASDITDGAAGDSGGTGSSGLLTILSEHDLQKVFEIVDQQQDFYEALKSSLRNDTTTLRNLTRCLARIKGNTAVGSNSRHTYL